MSRYTTIAADMVCLVTTCAEKIYIKIEMTAKAKRINPQMWPIVIRVLLIAKSSDHNARIVGITKITAIIM
jgi:hypothetical protein